MFSSRFARRMSQTRREVKIVSLFSFFLPSKQPTSASLCSCSHTSIKHPHFFVFMQFYATFPFCILPTVYITPFCQACHIILYICVSYAVYKLFYDRISTQPNQLCLFLSPFSHLRGIFGASALQNILKTERLRQPFRFPSSPDAIR